MKSTTLAVTLALSLVVPGVAYADDADDEYEETEEVEIVRVRRAPPPAREGRPSTGTGFLVPGGILTGLGVVNLATAPLCTTDLVDRRVQDECLVASLVLGGVFVAVGLPLLIVGGVKRAKFREWQERRRPLPVVSFAPFDGGGSFVLGGSF